jgi:hypothetical protein
MKLQDKILESKKKFCCLQCIEHKADISPLLRFSKKKKGWAEIARYMFDQLVLEGYVEDGKAELTQKGHNYLKNRRNGK